MPASQEPNITLDAPPARARATSRGQRTPPSAHTCLPSRAASVAHSTTAENCGRPTPVIIRVVHIAPGPTPTLTMSAPASISCRVPPAVTTLPATSGRSPATRADRLDGVEHAGLVAVGGVDDEHVDAHLDECLGLRVGVAVDADRDGDHQPAVGVERRAVVRRPERALAGDDAEQPAVGIDHRRDRAAVGREHLERGPGVDAVGDGDQLPAHHGVELGEAVEPGGIVLGEHADRTVVVVDDHDRPVGPLVDEPEGVADRVVRRQRDRGLVDLVAALHVVDHRADDVERDVLRQDHDAAAAGDGLGHPLAGHRGHVRHHHGDRRADAVGRRQVDVEAATARRRGSAP